MDRLDYSSQQIQASPEDYLDLLIASEANTEALPGELQRLLNAIAGANVFGTSLPGMEERFEARGVDPESPGGAVGQWLDWTGPLTKAMAAAPLVGKIVKGGKIPLRIKPERLGPKDFKTRKLKGADVYVGAPPGVKTEEDIMRLAEQYADRVERALDAGVPPGYFYEKGANVIREISPNDVVAHQAARANAITSSEAPVRTNFGWAGKAFEQKSAGHPVNTGKYPQEMSAKIEDVLAGNDPHLGEKRELYGMGLSGDARKIPEEFRRAPNDRWEIRSYGYDKDTATEQQHVFMHNVRRIAADIVNERRGTKFDPYTAQELNWATARAEGMGIPIEEAARDNLQESLDYYMMNHSWESVPGQKSNHLAGVDMETYDPEVEKIFIDPETGRDRFADAMGATFQRPVMRGPGVFGDQVHPYGYQSQSQVFHAGGQLDPASRERVEGMDAVRDLFLGQDAYAGSLSLPSKRKTVPEFGGSLMYELDEPLTTETAQQLVTALAGQHGAGSFGVVPTRAGVNVISTGAKNLQKSGPDIEGILGVEGGDIGLFSGTGYYDELPWAEGKATEHVLNKLTPGMAKHADSPATRSIAGELASLYRRLEAAGEKPNAKLTDVLEAWSTGGLPLVQKMVQQGLAPVAVLGILGAGALQQTQPERGQGRVF